MRLLKHFLTLQSTSLASKYYHWCFVVFLWWLLCLTAYHLSYLIMIKECEILDIFLGIFEALLDWQIIINLVLISDSKQLIGILQVAVWLLSSAVLGVLKINYYGHILICGDSGRSSEPDLRSSILFTMGRHIFMNLPQNIRKHWVCNG